MMKRTIFRRIASIAVVLAAGLCASAQEADADRVYAPFVSKLSAVDRGGKAALSWLDSRDAAGPAFVFRAAFPIEPEVLAKAQKIAEVPYGAQSYIDTPPHPGKWYYYVAASDAAGTRYDLMLPYTNVASAVVSEAAESAVSGSAAAKAPAPEPAKIGAVKAAVKDDAVVVSFVAAASVANVIVYRSASRIERATDLLDAVIVQSAPASAAPVIDYPVPGISYFYALIPEEDLKTGRIAIEKGINSTIVPVEVPAGRYRVGLPGPPRDIRAMPLPLISLDSALPDSIQGSLPPAAPGALSAAAEKAVAELLAGMPQKKGPERKPRAFPQDLETPAGGEEYVLRSIVQGPFAKKEWEESAKQIVRYLSLSRSQKSEARARYYLGQAYYFTGRFPDALFEFLLAQSQYYAESQEWIDAVLPKLGDTEDKVPVSAES